MCVRVCFYYFFFHTNENDRVWRTRHVSIGPTVQDDRRAGNNHRVKGYGRQNIDGISNDPWAPLGHWLVEFPRDWPAWKVTSSSHGEYRNRLCVKARWWRNERPIRVTFKIKSRKKRTRSAMRGYGESRVSSKTVVRVYFLTITKKIIFRKQRPLPLASFFFLIAEEKGIAGVCPLPWHVTRSSSQSASSERKRHSCGVARSFELMWLFLRLFATRANLSPFFQLAENDVNKKIIDSIKKN